MPYNEKGEYGTAHTFDTQNPQSYEAHKRVAHRGGWLLFKGAFASWIHGTWPEWERWQFWTSTLVIKLTLQLWLSRRHDREFAAIFGPEILEKLRIYRPKNISAQPGALGMPLFRCSKCGCAENTALGDYWMEAGTGRPVLCSECSPKTRKWHGRFPKQAANTVNGWRDDPQRPQFIERI